MTQSALTPAKLVEAGETVDMLLGVLREHGFRAGRVKISETGAVHVAVENGFQVKTIPQQIADMRLDPDNKNWVYFLKAMETDKIKIGFTTNLLSRMKALSNASPDSLHLMAVIPGTIKFEHEIHRIFYRERKQGEWFAASDDLKRFIDLVQFEPWRVPSIVKLRLEG